MSVCLSCFFSYTGPTIIDTLSLHDALPICNDAHGVQIHQLGQRQGTLAHLAVNAVERFCSALDLGRQAGIIQAFSERSEEHTSELQSRGHLVCRLLLEKKKLVAQFVRLEQR